MFESMPAIVELFGHQRIAGKLSDVSIGGTALLRVDVPSLDDTPAFTKFYGTGAIYAITPVDEPTMMLAVKSFRSVPVDRWSLNVETRPALSSGDDDFSDDDDEFSDDDDAGEIPF